MHCRISACQVSEQLVNDLKPSRLGEKSEGSVDGGGQLDLSSITTRDRKVTAIRRLLGAKDRRWGALPLRRKVRSGMGSHVGSSKGLGAKHTCLPTHKVAHREYSYYKFPQEEDGRRGGILPHFLQHQGLGLSSNIVSHACT